MNGADYQVENFDLVNVEKTISLIRARVENMDCSKEEGGNMVFQMITKWYAY